MSEYKVVEIFESINGEGMKAGELAVFVRLAFCNLRCSYCDTMWACMPDAPFKIMTEEEIAEIIFRSGINNVTLTGGEPLNQPDIDILLKKLIEKENINIEIETNGSIDVAPYRISDRITFTLDYKLPGSKMEEHMELKNFEYISPSDTVKFVISDQDDLEKSYEILEKYNLPNRCNCIYSPVFGQIEPVEIVENMKQKNLNKVRFQLQLHKFIWDPEKRGV